MKPKDLRTALEQLQQFAELNEFYECTCGTSEAVSTLDVHHERTCKGYRDLLLHTELLSALQTPLRYVIVKFPSYPEAHRWMQWMDNQGEQDYWTYMDEHGGGCPRFTYHHGQHVIIAEAQEE